VSALVEITAASFNRGIKPALEGIHWTVRPGEHWLISGNSGAGKSTLIQALSGACHLSEGTLSFPALEQAGASTYETRTRYLRVVSFRNDAGVFDPSTHFYQQRFNSFAADGTLRVAEFLQAVGFNEREPAHRALIEQMGLTALLPSECVKLSSGQSRRLLLAKALVQEPELLVLDNPYLGLDVPGRQDFNEFLDRLVASGEIHLILASTGREWPSCMTHRLHLDGCEITAAGPLSGFGETAVDSIDANVSGPALDALRDCFPSPKEVGGVLFDLSHVDVRYGSATVLNDVTWQVRRGEKWTLLGDNGAGKSTLLALLFGDHPQAYANQIHVYGHRRGPGQSIWEVKQHTGFTSSELHQSFAAKVSCAEAVRLGLFDDVYRRDEVTAEEQQRMDLLFEYFDIVALKARPFHAVSTGEQRLVLLIRALAKNPVLLLLDEPFQGFDDIAVRRARRLLSEVLGPEHSVVFITHYPEEIPEGVDRLATLVSGELSLSS